MTEIDKDAKFWIDKGAVVLPAYLKSKKVALPKYKQYRKAPPTDKENQEWFSVDKNKKQNKAVFMGRLKNDKNLICLDFDDKKAVDTVPKKLGYDSLDEMKKHTRVEGHKDNPNKAHAYFIVDYQLDNQGLDIDENVPGLEVRATNMLTVIVAGSVHEDGYPYEVLGIEDIAEVGPELKTNLENFFKEYNISYMGNGIVKEKKRYQRILHENGEWKETVTSFDPTKKIPKRVRHTTLMPEFGRHVRIEWGKKTQEDFIKWALERNDEWCQEALPDDEIIEMMSDVIEFIRDQIKQESNKNDDSKKYPELKDNVYYRINEKPKKYIIAYKQKNTLIQADERTPTVKGDDKNQNQNLQNNLKYLHHSRTFLACIPVKIIRHKNPLTFLQLQETFTIIFIDAMGEYYTLNHKTLSSIIQFLKERALVLSDGADSALSAIIQGFKQRNLIEINEELGYTGFFRIGNKILASNLEIKELSIDKLSDALAFIEELKTYYENRLDLLAHSIVWGMIAPAIFMLKRNNYFLNGLNFYGFSNAGKSNTGKIILAIDGNHEDHNNHALNFNMVDTTAKLGSAVSRSTFPILIDEVDLNDIRNSHLVNMIKIIIESIKARDKFANSKDSDPSSIPALSCLILTSNLPPPFHNSGLMRRLTSRASPINETWKQDDPRAIEFKEFLRNNLSRLKALGDFRNWYIINNQDEFLDENKPEPLDLGLKILKEAFKFCSKEIPQWLIDERLPENQLEESMQDNDVIVKRAFEKYIDEQFNKAIQFWKSQLSTGEPIDIPKDISDRLVNLAQSNVLPDIKYTGNFDVIIRKGILSELYNHGVTKDQLPNLRALADYMKADYRISHGKTVVSATKAKLTAYFDESGESGESGESLYIDTNLKNSGESG